MNHSSTSSSELVQPRIASATAVRFFAALVGVLLVVEGLLRIPAVIRALPVRTHLHQPGLVRRLESLDRFEKDYGRVDVLFVGSSVVRCNINPAEFDRDVNSGGAPRRAPVSFNAGLSALWPRPVSFYLQHVWLPTARPRVVVQGIRYGELLPSARARNEAEILSGPLESLWAEPTLLHRLQAEGLWRVHLLHYRGAFPRWLLSHRRGMPGYDVDDDPRVNTDPRGWTARLPTLDVVRARGLVRSEAPYSGELPDESRRALAAIQQSARQASQAGARFILVNVPEHAFRWSAPGGDARYRSYLHTLAAAADEGGFSFVDVTRGNPRAFSSDAEFSDYHHMSPAGARRFTRALAQELEAGPFRAVPVAAR
jgi:hypothetical protein